MSSILLPKSAQRKRKTAFSFHPHNNHQCYEELLNNLPEAIQLYVQPKGHNGMRRASVHVYFIKGNLGKGRGSWGSAWRRSHCPSLAPWSLM